MATYSKTYTLDFTDGGDTVYEACDKLEDNVDTLVSNLNTCHTAARGDMIYKGASAVTPLTVGAQGRYIRSDGTDPGYAHLFYTVAKNDAYTTTLADDVILVNTAAARTITLGTAAVADGKVVIIKDSDGTGAGTNNITVDTEGSETIDGGADYTMDADRESVTIISNGTNWFIISSYKE